MICPSCKGVGNYSRGEDDAEFLDCYRCRGSGEVEAIAPVVSKLKKPTNALKLPISKLIERLQKLPPGTTYEELEGEFYGGGSREIGLGISYQMRIEIVEGFES